MYNWMYRNERNMNRSTDITSFTQHRRLLRQHLDQARVTGRPIFITSKGEPDGVVLSPEAYDSLVERAELADSLQMLDHGMEDSRNGRVRPLKQAVHEIAEGLDLNLE